MLIGKDMVCFVLITYYACFKLGLINNAISVNEKILDYCSIIMDL